MAKYLYRAVDRSGKKVAGELEARNEGEVRMQLRSMNLRPTSITREGVMTADLGQLVKRGTGSVSLVQLLGFTRQLQVLISSGIPVVQGLDILSEQALDKNVKGIFSQLSERVSGGSFLWEAMSQHPKAFPKMYVALVRAGESSGSIDQMLGRLGRYLEGSEKLRRQVKSAMMYPVIVFFIAVAVITVLLWKVIPEFEKMLTSAGQELPAPTKFVIGLSHGIQNHWLGIFVTLIVAVVLAVSFYRSQEGRATIDRVVYRIPVFGPLAQRSGTARFSRTMGTLLASGVNLIDAVDICRATVDNSVLEDAVGRIRSEIEAGKTLGTTIGRLNVFPSMAVQMISVGEATGALDKMLERVADFYEEEVEMMVAGMTKMIEPLMIFGLGGTIGLMLIAMYLPIFKLAGSM